MANSLFIASPAYGGQCSIEHRDSLVSLIHRLIENGIPYPRLASVDCCYVPMARNGLAELFLKSSCSHLLFLDADMGFDVDDVVRMFEFSAHPKYGVLAASYPKKSMNLEAIKQAVLSNPKIHSDSIPYVGLSTEWTFKVSKDQPMSLNSPVEVEGLPTGVMLIRREVLEKMNPPYFDCRWIDGVYTGEDWLFCMDVRNSGGKVWMAPWVKTVHVGRFAYPGSIEKTAKSGVDLVV